MSEGATFQMSLTATAAGLDAGRLASCEGADRDDSIQKNLWLTMVYYGLIWFCRGDSGMILGS